MGNPYAFGRKSIETYRLQVALVERKFLPEIDPATGQKSADYIYGTKTKDAVTTIQHMLGIVATGQPDKAVLVYLGLIPQPASNPLQDFIVQAVIKAVLANLKGRLPMLTGYKTYGTAALLAVMAIYSVLFGDLPIIGHVDLSTIVVAFLASLGLGFSRTGAKTEAANAVAKLLGRTGP